MAKIVVVNQKPQAPSIKPSDINAGEVFTWGKGKYFYIKTNSDEKVCLSGGQISSFVDYAPGYTDLRVIATEVYVYDQAKP